MSESQPARLWCGTCLAPLKPGEQVCSRCGWKVGAVAASPALRSSPDKTLADEGPPAFDRGTSATFSLGTLLLAITVFCVLLGITVAAPGLGIPLALLAVPPAIRTAMVVRRRKDGGLKTSGAEKATLFVMSAFVTWVIVICLISSCCLTFCGVCAGGLLLSGGNPDEQVLLMFAGAVTLVVGILVVWAFSFWIRGRWRRDVSKW